MDAVVCCCDCVFAVSVMDFVCFLFGVVYEIFRIFECGEGLFDVFLFFLDVFIYIYIPK